MLSPEDGSESNANERERTHPQPCLMLFHYAFVSKASGTYRAAPFESLSTSVRIKGQCTVRQDLGRITASMI
jgi:hypothetical protein